MTVTNDRLQAALAYAELGWPVFPVWWWDPTLHEGAGGCACGEPACSSPAKHPLYNRAEGLVNGLYAATEDPDRIRHWWALWPEANIGSPTGAIAGYDVLDVDLQHDGMEAWRQLVDGHEPVPDTTPLALTPSGGRHFRFVHEDGQTNARGNLPTGIDVRGDGGYVLLPPSATERGGYSWFRAPEAGADTPWPRWLLGIVRPDEGQEPRRRGRPRANQNASSDRTLPEVIGDGRRNLLLTSEAGRLRRRNYSADEMFDALWSLNLSRCEPPLAEVEVWRIANSVARYAPPEDAGHRNSDTYNAQEFVQRYGQDLRYVPIWKQWYWWDERRWALDRLGRAIQWAKEFGLLMQAEAEAIEEEGDRVALMRRARAAQQSGKIKAILDLAWSEPGMSLHHDELDADPWALNLQNGTLDLRTGELRPQRKEDNLTQLVALPWDPEADCPHWERFLREILREDATMITYLQRALGYCLTGSVREQKLFIPWGVGANGKSTFFSTILNILGPYGVLTEPGLLLMKNHESHPTGIADLHQRRIAVAMETGMGRRMDETLVKQLTGGDPIKARRMREDFWTFYPTHKLWLVSNHRPNVRDLGVAFWRRIQLVPFTVQIPPRDQDPELPAKLLRESVGILRWMVEGCLSWQRRGLDVPPAVEVATNEYREDTDWLGAWIEACCEEDPRAMSTFEELFGSFKEWSNGQSQGLKNLNPQEFGGVLTDRGYGKKKSNGKTYRLGLQLKEGQRTVQRRIALGA